jgi:hypothetical protein
VLVTATNGSVRALRDVRVPRSRVDDLARRP